MKKNNNLKSVIKEINKYNNIIRESYVFDDENNDDMLLDDNEYDDDEDGVEFDSSKSAEDRINEIRSIALEGIQEFAEEVDSNEYNIFKNIWMTCDKFYTSKNKENEEMK